MISMPASDRRRRPRCASYHTQSSLPLSLCSLSFSPPLVPLSTSLARPLAHSHTRPLARSRVHTCKTLAFVDDYLTRTRARPVTWPTDREGCLRDREVSPRRSVRREREDRGARSGVREKEGVTEEDGTEGRRYWIGDTAWGIVAALALPVRRHPARVVLALRKLGVSALGGAECYLAIAFRQCRGKRNSSCLT